MPRSGCAATGTGRSRCHELLRAPARRAAHRCDAAPAPAAAPPPPRPPREEPPDGTAVLVEYRGVSRARLHRGISGRSYTFTHARRTRSVAADDAAELLRDGDFRPGRP